MKYFLFLVFLLAGASPHSFSAEDGHFSCVQVVIHHAERRQKVETQQYWANVYQKLVEAKALQSDEPFLRVTPAQAASFGFGFGVMKELQNSYRRFMMGVVYELVLSRLSRTAGLLGGAPAEYSGDAAAAYYLSHILHFQRGQNPNATEKRLELGGEIFGQFPSLEEMYAISEDPKLTAFEIESRISNVLKNGIRRVRLTLENGADLEGEFAQKAHYLSGSPEVVLQYARDHAPTDPVLRVNLVDIEEPAIRALHQAVLTTVRIKGSTPLGCALKVAPTTATRLIKDLRTIEKILGE